MTRFDSMKSWLREAPRKALRGAVGAVEALRERRRSVPKPEHPFLLRRQRFFYSTKANFLLATAVLWFGLWAEFWGGDLKHAVESAWHGWVGALRHGAWAQLIDRGVDGWAVAFAVVLVGVTWLIAKRLKAEDDNADETSLEVFRAITLAPNARIHEAYHVKYWTAFTEELAPALEAGAPRLEVAEAIRGALRVIAEMAAHFARAESTRATYGANIMLVVRRSDGPGLLFPPSLVEALIFHSPTDLGSLMGMLYLPGDLLVASLDATERPIPHIALPVPDTVGRTAHLVIPGAPRAARSGGSIHPDARQIAYSEECQSFANWIQDDILHYFSSKGRGHAVGSFASFRIGTDKEPVGVLNIDTSSQFVLGRHEEFYDTFIALLVPMLEALRPAVQEYAAGLDVGALAAREAATAAGAEGSGSDTGTSTGSDAGAPPPEATGVTRNLEDGEYVREGGEEAPSEASASERRDLDREGGESLPMLGVTDREPLASQDQSGSAG